VLFLPLSSSTSFNVSQSKLWRKQSVFTKQKISLKIFLLYSAGGDGVRRIGGEALVAVAVTGMVVVVVAAAMGGVYSM